MKWDLALLLFVLIVSMLPSANVFRWSFRWLPLVHLVLAVCAAKILQDMELSRRRIFSGTGSWALLIVALAIATMLVIGTSGRNAWPLAAILLSLAALWTIIDLLPDKFRGLQQWMPAVITFAALLATYLCVPTNYGVPKYNLSQELLSPAPLDPQRLYLSIYPPPEIVYGFPATRRAIGQVVRPGSTSMWARLHFINGYSPVRAAGVARAFSSYVHGEIDPDAANYFLGSQAGRDGELAKLGVDGIIVANEMQQLVPKPETEWDLIHLEEEGCVYHRRDGPFERVRAVSALDSRPNEQFAIAAVTLIENSRNRVVADVKVAGGDRPALLTFSRPFFRGYQARIDATNYNVGSYHGLIPTVELPAGANGRLVLVYRPRWLIWGGAAAALSLLILLSSLLARLVRRTDQ